MATDECISVAVRVRPCLPRETANSVVRVQGATTELLDPRTGAVYRRFTFDHSLWSFSEDDPHYVGQDVVYSRLGAQLLSSALEGYNVTMFAYGQTGSGKTYSMFGTPTDPGITPRFVRELFAACPITSGGRGETGAAGQPGASVEVRRRARPYGREARRSCRHDAPCGR